MAGVSKRFRLRVTSSTPADSWPRPQQRASAALCRRNLRADAAAISDDDDDPHIMECAQRGQQKAVSAGAILSRGAPPRALRHQFVAGAIPPAIFDDDLLQAQRSDARRSSRTAAGKRPAGAVAPAEPGRLPAARRTRTAEPPPPLPGAPGKLRALPASRGSDATFSESSLAWISDEILVGRVPLLARLDAEVPLLDLDDPSFWAPCDFKGSAKFGVTQRARVLNPGGIQLMIDRGATNLAKLCIIHHYLNAHNASALVGDSSPYSKQFSSEFKKLAVEWSSELRGVNWVHQPAEAEVGSLPDNPMSSMTKLVAYKAELSPPEQVETHSLLHQDGRGCSVKIWRVGATLSAQGEGSSGGTFMVHDTASGATAGLDLKAGQWYAASTAVRCSGDPDRTRPAGLNLHHARAFIAAGGAPAGTEVQVLVPLVEFEGDAALYGAAVTSLMDALDRMVEVPTFRYDGCERSGWWCPTADANGGLGGSTSYRADGVAYSAGLPTKVPDTDLYAVASRCLNPVGKHGRSCDSHRKRCRNAPNGGGHSFRTVTGAEALGLTSAEIARHLGIVGGHYHTAEDKVHKLLADKGITATKSHIKVGIAGLLCGSRDASWICRG